MTLPRLPTVTTRVATPSDIDLITELVAACEVANDGLAEVHRTDVEQALSLAGRDAIVAEAPNQLAGWASLAGDRATVDVHPAWQGRGIGSALRGWTEERARAAGLARVRQIVSDGDERARHSFEADDGYRPIYAAWILDMLLGASPPEVDVPPGVTIRPFRPEDAAAVHRVIEDAFNEWPDRRPTDFASWSAHIVGHAAFAPHLSRLAFVGDELVGAALSDDYEGQDDGWVQQLATKATHRHRGIARALLQSVFAAFHATGRRHVGLSTNSTTGALALYERLGMRVRRSYTAWARDLAPSDVAR